MFLYRIASQARHFCAPFRQLLRFPCAPILCCSIFVFAVEKRREKSKNKENRLRIVGGGKVRKKKSIIDAKSISLAEPSLADALRYDVNG